MESEISDQVTANISTVNRTINSCIQVKEAKISRKTTIPHQVHFCLDSDLIRQIEWVQANKSKLILSASNLASLRYYALVNTPLEQIGISPWRSSQLSFFPRSSISFSTNYLLPNSQQPLTLFRTVIDLEGNISQQIHQDLWQNSPLLSKISQVHYWLILEILSQLPLKSKSYDFWLVSACSMILASIIILIINYFVSLNYLLYLTIFLTIILIINTTLKKIIVKHLKPLLIYHLRAGFLSKNIRLRQIGLQILNFII